MTKAYLVDCDGEYGAQLYFASTRGQAKMSAANDEGTDITGVRSCKRAPQYDEYSPGPVPLGVLIADGWTFECSGCGRMAFEEEGAPLVIEDRQVWCSAECKTRAEECERRYRAECEQREAECRAALLAKFPDAQIERIHSYGRLLVDFRVPVSTQESISWEVCSSCVYVSRCDLDAWYRYEDQRLAPVAAWEDDGGAAAQGGDAWPGETLSPEMTRGGPPL